ncbi:phytanoyl-CoA dioxygenase family protein [Paenibacillus chitinolyticus]|uniref:phytanoyl-CoA dioxygenase family protein n=1 Tax=Paenibacillus chitinolyticus TaxID=79263 RepID=UPI002DBBF1F0|nr:phytanoyl-CoA dioxygenase family protein [Paenibacillus chitinolyticus]MEC0248501.1 phytanoyl-CoA dioxygenase family protein [Paenibacillus chitinolyticus]
MEHSYQTLALLQEEYKLTRQEIDSYQANGHLMIRGMIGAEVIRHFRETIVNLAGKMYQEDSHLSIREGDKKQGMLVSHLWKRSQFLTHLAFSRRFAKTAAKLMGVEAVRLYVDYAVFKEPGDKATGWHQDHNHTLIGTDHTTTIWIPLIDLPEEMGSMGFLSGSQTLTDRTKGDSRHMREAHRKNMEYVHYGAMMLGDVTFHSGWVLHNANANETDRVREVYSVTYVEDGVQMLDPGENKELRETVIGSAHFPGMRPGDYMQGVHFPLLYS